MRGETRRSWATGKISSYLYADERTGRFEPEEGWQHKEALVQELLDSYRGRCNLCSGELVWMVYSEGQPTLDHLDCSLPHTTKNVDVKCLKCNRGRGGLGRGGAKNKVDKQEDR